jgi:hypothetical protein
MCRRRSYPFSAEQNENDIAVFLHFTKQPGQIDIRQSDDQVDARCFQAIEDDLCASFAVTALHRR